MNNEPHACDLVGYECFQCAFLSTCLWEWCWRCRIMMRARHRQVQCYVYTFNAQYSFLFFFFIKCSICNCVVDFPILFFIPFFMWHEDDGDAEEMRMHTCNLLLYILVAWRKTIWFTCLLIHSSQVNIFSPYFSASIVESCMMMHARHIWYFPRGRYFLYIPSGIWKWGYCAL